MLSLVFILMWNSSTKAEDLALQREQAREIMRTMSCAGCHTPNLSTTNNRALKVYNLAAPYWTATMTDRQLTAFKGRFGAERDRLTETQKKRVLSLMDKELTNRNSDPTARFRELQERKFPDFYKLFSAGL